MRSGGCGSVPDRPRGKKSLSGSFTVEASLVVPLIILSTALLVYFSFFLYDRCILSQQTCITALRGSYREEGHKPEEQTLLAEYKNRLKESLIAVGEVDSSCKMSMDTAEVAVKTDLTLPFSGMAKAYFGFGGWEISIKKKFKNVTGVSFIRNCKIIESIVK